MTSTTSTPPAAPPLPSEPTTTAIASSSSTTPNPSLTPLQAASLRLSALEHLLYGPSSSSTTTTSRSTPALLRLTSTLTTLSTLSSTSKPLHRLLADWSLYSDLLSPLPSFPQRSEWDAAQQSSYILALDPELRSSLAQLEAIHRLVHERNVLEGGRDLTRALDANQTKLHAAQQSDANARHTTEKANQRLILLVRRWSEYTSTLSQAFTLLDSQLLNLERQLAAIEREHS